MTTTPPHDGRAGKAGSFNARFNAALNRVLTKLKVEEVPHIKRIIITVVGGTVVLIGAALVFLPGPGLLVILGGFAILGTEYAWARRWMRKGKLMAKKAVTQTQKILTAKEYPDASVQAAAEQNAASTEAGGALESVGDEKTTLVH